MVSARLFEPGQKFGPYLISRFHSKSRVTESYSAFHTEMKVHVVLTLSMFKHLAEGPPKLSKFIATAASLLDVDTDAATRIVDLGAGDFEGMSDALYWIGREDKGNAISLAAFMAGAPVATEPLQARRALLKEKPEHYRFAFAVLIGITAAEAMMHCEGNAIAHGGIDANTTIALGEDGAPFLLDVGYSRLFGPEHVRPQPGGPDFRSPEVRGGGEATIRGDVYSIGAVMLWILTGSEPAAGLARTLVDRAGPEKASTNAVKLLTVIAKAMETEPSGRFLSAASLKNALSVLSDAILGRKTSRPNAATDADDAAPTPRAPQAPAFSGGRAATAMAMKSSARPRHLRRHRRSWAPRRVQRSLVDDLKSQKLIPMWIAAGLLLGTLIRLLLFSGSEPARLTVSHRMVPGPTVWPRPRLELPAPKAPAPLPPRDRSDPDRLYLGPERTRPEWDDACAEWAICGGQIPQFYDIKGSL